jgi:hypothetical protein
MNIQNNYPRSTFLVISGFLAVCMSGCLFQNNALPNRSVNLASSATEEPSQKDNFLSCMPEILTLPGSDAGTIILETSHPCFEPQAIESVDYFLSDLTNQGGSLLSRAITSPYHIRHKWFNGSFYFSETKLKSGEVLRSKNIAINPYDYYTETAKVSFSQPFLNCLPKVLIKNDTETNFNLSVSAPCFMAEDIQYVFYSWAYSDYVKTARALSAFKREETPHWLVRGGVGKFTQAPFGTTVNKCNEYSGNRLSLTAQIKLKSGEYLTAAPAEVEFPKTEGCPPPPSGQSGVGSPEPSPQPISSSSASALPQATKS